MLQEKSTDSFSATDERGTTGPHTGFESEFMQSKTKQYHQ